VSTLIHPDQLRLIRYGLKVSRAAKVLPATATETIFTVSGGRIRLTGLIGQVAVAMDATVTNLSMVSTPTTGTQATLGTVVAVASTAVGASISLNPVFGGALAVTAGGAGVLPGGYELVIPPGNIQIATTATNAGVVRWDLLYVPFDDAGSVAAA
jgi:hypothetical protein